MWHHPISLEGRYVRLEPLTLAHAEPMLAHFDAEMVQYMSHAPQEPTLAAMQGYIHYLLAAPDRVNWAILDKDTGQMAGRTGYVRVNPEYRYLETTTWIFTEFQGGQANPESKYLLIRHAFETLGAIRVQFRADANNTRSCRAIEKLGAVREGTLRKDQIYPSGIVRSTAVFSILDEEWAGVKKRLEARLYPTSG
ncbi:MAG: GNAT family N-acetyltransferase [Thermaceae bacterium]|nr:GNAT family N-acetyltransferase [Thermaceae bacterium]